MVTNVRSLTTEEDDVAERTEQIRFLSQLEADLERSHGSKKIGQIVPSVSSSSQTRKETECPVHGPATTGREA